MASFSNNSANKYSKVGIYQKLMFGDSKDDKSVSKPGRLSSGKKGVGNSTRTYIPDEKYLNLEATFSEFEEKLSMGDEFLFAEYVSKSGETSNTVVTNISHLKSEIESLSVYIGGEIHFSSGSKECVSEIELLKNNRLKCLDLIERVVCIQANHDKSATIEKTSFFDRV